MVRVLNYFETLKFNLLYKFTILFVTPQNFLFFYSQNTDFMIQSLNNGSLQNNTSIHWLKKNY